MFLENGHSLENLKVYVRLKPSVSERPICHVTSPTDFVCQEPGQPAIEVRTNGVFDVSSGQRDVFESVMSPIIQQSISNRTDVCLLLYGTKASGKSFTLFGNGHDDSRGIIYRCLEAIFALRIEEAVYASINEIANDHVYDLAIFYRYHLHSSEGLNTSSRIQISSPGQLEGLLRTALHHRRSSESSIVISFAVGTLAMFSFIESTTESKQLETMENILVDIQNGAIRTHSNSSVQNQYMRQLFTFNCQPIMITTFSASELSSIPSAWFLKRLTQFRRRPLTEEMDFLRQEVHRLSKQCQPKEIQPSNIANHENEASVDNRRAKLRRPSTSNVYSNQTYEQRKLQNGYQAELVSSGRSDYVRDNKLKHLQEKLEKANSELLKITSISMSNESKFFAIHQQNTAKIKQLEEAVLMKEIEMRQRIDEIEHNHVEALEVIARENRDMVEKARKEVRLNVLKLDAIANEKISYPRCP